MKIAINTNIIKNIATVLIFCTHILTGCQKENIFKDFIPLSKDVTFYEIRNLKRDSLLIRKADDSLISGRIDISKLRAGEYILITNFSKTRFKIVWQ